MPNPNDLVNLIKSIKLCSINISGMSDRSRIVTDKYCDLKKFHIMFMQETGSSCITKLHLTNMKVYTDSNDSKNRGAALYVRDNITFTRLTSIQRLSKQIDSVWGLVVISNVRYIIGSIYLKLNYNNAISDVLKMLEEAEKMSKKYKASGVILAGDYNARHGAWGDHVHNKYGNELFEKLDNTKYTICTSDTPTFKTENGSSIIDFFIVSSMLSDEMEKCKTDEEVELFSGAPLRGHFPLISKMVIKNARHNTPTQVQEKLDIESINWEDWSKEIEEAIQRIEGTTQTETDNPTLIWNLLEELIKDSSNKHGKRKKSTKHSKPYWTEKLTELLNDMKTSRITYNRRNTDHSKEIMLHAKELFDSERKKACEDFILEKTKDLNTAEAVLFWKKFNMLFKSKTDKGVDPLIDETKGLVTENKEIEEKLFETFFESKHLVAENFDEHFYEEVIGIYEEIKSARFEPQDNQGRISELREMLNAEITIQEVKKAIKKTKGSNKSLDNHNMHPKMLHNLGPNALEVLRKLFNRCLDRGEWIWNEAEVIFLKKEGKDSYSVPGAYRPISISSYIGKVLEKILAERITQFLELQGIFDPDQEGFTAKRNTNRYLNRLILEIKTDLKDHTVIGLFIDLETAFDSIWKKGLMVKMSALNFGGKSLALIDNFLTDRHVKLNVNGELGESRDCKEYGLPQGSALSPVLFKIFLLDLFEDLNSCEDISFLKFADDGTIKIRNKESIQCVESLKNVVNALNEWTRKWRININCQPNKTEYICFGTADQETEVIPDTIKMGSKEVKKVKETKVLGLIVDEDLNFNSHSKKVYNNILGKWVKVCKYTNQHWGFNQKVISQIAKTFFLTSLHYAGIIWMNDKNMKDIEQIWYKIIKSAIGATFNIRKSLAEVIIGIPPLKLQNKMHRVKYYLKLNINSAKEDRVRDFIQMCYDDQEQANIVKDLTTSIKEVFKFLKWKVENYPDITEDEVSIITNSRYDEYFKLSSKCCSYTKTMMTRYTEKVWHSSIINEYSLEGYNNVPVPSCSPLPIPKDTTRKQEVLLMSLFYPNNLFNDNVYRHTYQAESPLCRKCSVQEETPCHIILQCSNLSEVAYRHLRKEIGEERCRYEDTTTLLNASRSQDFIKTCLDILAQAEYRNQIDLTN